MKKHWKNKNKKMSYLKIPDYNSLISRLKLYSQLKHEYRAKGIKNILSEAEKAIKLSITKLKKLSNDKSLTRNEPNDLQSIRHLRPEGPRRIWTALNKELYLKKLEGAFLARMAGCTLGAIVEGWEIQQMEEWAKEIGDKFPPVDYWSKAKIPSKKRYGMSRCEEYTRDKISGVPADDDIVYTLLNLLIVEEYGPGFTTEDVGKEWLKYLPMACTAEEIALKNLKAGVPAKQAASKNNPFVQWIGADIRSDPWAYMAPGFPEKAAEMAYRDAYLSHRRNGIYGEMFFAAAQSAAFAVSDPIEAIKIGLTEIPRDCLLARDIRWALDKHKKIRNFRKAREAVDKHCKGMSYVHTNNNACLTIFGLAIGGNDVTKVLSEIVAMGMDNDCTAATAGSIVGAIVGKKGIPNHWYKNFNNTVYSYLIGKRKFSFSSVVERFAKQAEKIFKLDKGLSNRYCKNKI